MRAIAFVTLLSFILSACAFPSQNSYSDRDVGHNAVILFGTVLSVRQVEIQGTNSGAGAGVGVLAGGLAGTALGRGNGSLIGLLGGAVIGGITGVVAEQTLKDRQGIEYIVKFPVNGTTQSIVQNIAKKDIPLEVGQCVMVQMNGTYQRVLPSPDESQCHPVKKHRKSRNEDDES